MGRGRGCRGDGSGHGMMSSRIEGEECAEGCVYIYCAEPK